MQTAFFCSLCQADCNSVQMMQSHVAGRKHQMNLAKEHGGGFGGFGKDSDSLVTRILRFGHWLCT